MKGNQTNFTSELDSELKQNFIMKNMVSLKAYTKQIQLLLNQIEIVNNPIAASNLLFCKNTMDNLTKTTPFIWIQWKNEYTSFGHFFNFLISNSDDNLKSDKHIKQIATLYLDVAKLMKIEKITQIAFIIADKLTVK